MRFWGLIVILLTTVPAAAKPLYITVPRTFGTDEGASIDIAFAEHEPVELRVLQPIDLDAFLTSQTNLRRAYSEPQVVTNPGRYLARGINAVRSPGTFLLYALTPEI